MTASIDVSQRIGDGLLRGWTLLATTCPKCRCTPMMRETSETELCVACDMEPELGEERVSVDATTPPTESPISTNAIALPTESPVSSEDFVSISLDGQVPESSTDKKEKGRRTRKKKSSSKKAAEPRGTEGKEGSTSESNGERSKRPAKRYFTTDAVQTAAKDRPQLEKKVHFAESVVVEGDKKSFDHPELKHNVFAALTATILATSEDAFSSSDIADHHRVCKCLSLQLDGLAVLRRHLGTEKFTVDLSDLHRSLLLRMEKIVSLPTATVEAAKLQYKTTSRLCRLLARVNEGT